MKSYEKKASIMLADIAFYFYQTYGLPHDIFKEEIQNITKGYNLVEYLTYLTELHNKYTV